MKKFNLSLKICYPETAFRQKFGNQIWETLKKATHDRDRYECAGCNIDASSVLGSTDLKQLEKTISIHIVSINETNPLESETVTLCKGCHATQHIDLAIEKKWISLVNAVENQGQLINYHRSHPYAIDPHNIKPLKMTPEEFLEKFKNGEIGESNTIKATLTTHFSWS